MRGFITFIREQGIMGLAIGFLLGGAASRVVSSLVNDIINPLVGLGLQRVGTLTDLVLNVGDARVEIGNFFSTLIDFLIIAAVVYFVFKGLRLDLLDKPKNKPADVPVKKVKK